MPYRKSGFLYMQCWQFAFDYFFPLFLCYLSTFETVKLQVSRNIVSQYFFLTIVLESVLKCSDTMNVVNTTICIALLVSKPLLGCFTRLKSSAHDYRESTVLTMLPTVLTVESRQGFVHGPVTRRGMLPIHLIQLSSGNRSLVVT